MNSQYLWGAAISFEKTHADKYSNNKHFLEITFISEIHIRMVVSDLTPFSSFCINLDLCKGGASVEHRYLASLSANKSSIHMQTRTRIQSKGKKVYSLPSLCNPSENYTAFNNIKVPSN